MHKSVFITEKPSVAAQFADALGIKGSKKDGYIESENTIITWCVGHLVTMSYPEKYDEKLKRWSMDTLPFLPCEYKYEIIPSVKKQFNIVSGILNREDVDVIYVCTDSGREGEYIYRLVEQMSGVKNKTRKRVWIDSQTEEEIRKGIRNAKDLSEYDKVSESAYLRAKEDYLMGINFSRVLTLKYGRALATKLNMKYAVVSVGRVMTCVLGMIVRREREIRDFVKTPFYRVIGVCNQEESGFELEWKSENESRYFESPYLYKENGFKEKEKAQELINYINENKPVISVVDKIERKKETKNPPLLYNLAELQNECSKMLKISPDETLKIVQTLYERKLVTYPRTDARVLSTAVAKEIHKNLTGLINYNVTKPYAEEIMSNGLYKNLAATRYVNDKQITDHYAIIPTGSGTKNLQSLKPQEYTVYEIIARRFVCIFLPPAVYNKISILIKVPDGEFQESFAAGTKVLIQEGYLKAAMKTKSSENEEENQLIERLKNIKKGDTLVLDNLFVKEGETSPPKRYNSGTIILAMENAGQLIEDEELRAQIKGCGIGTSATRAEILKKLVNIKYIALNKKTQIITPTQMGEMIFDIVNSSMKQLLNPELTASWERGLNYVVEGSVSPEEYMIKLEDFVTKRTIGVKGYI